MELERLELEKIKSAERLEVQKIQLSEKLELAKLEAEKMTKMEAGKLQSADMTELASEVHNMALVVHTIKEAIPTVVVGINITPSEASGKKGLEFKKLLDCLLIDPPIPTTDIFTDISLFSLMTDSDGSALAAFSWHWRDGRLELDSYEPFCTYVNGIKRDTEKAFYCYVVEKGQRLEDGWLFDHDIITLRSLDSQANKVKLVYRGHVRGRSDLVVMRYEPQGNIARHMIRFAIEVKTAEEMRMKLSSCIREAVTQVIGLCADNCGNSPCVILTDFTASFFVCYLRNSDKSSPEQLRYDIVIQSCDSILSALNKACAVSAFCISHDFCRPTTPEEFKV